MAGRIEGLMDVAWEVFRNIFSSEKPGRRGRPAVPSRNILGSPQGVVAKFGAIFSL